MSNTAIIFNPVAGSEQAERWRERIESVGNGCALFDTTRSSEAETLARHAAEQGFEKIVAAGGDGTINEVVNGLAGSNAALGLLPLGTVNVFAMELGLPANNFEFCWEVIQGDNMRFIDLPSANGKYFAQPPGEGFEAKVVRETRLASKPASGPPGSPIPAPPLPAPRPPSS